MFDDSDEDEDAAFENEENEVKVSNVVEENMKMKSELKEAY